MRASPSALFAPGAFDRVVSRFTLAGLAMAALVVSVATSALAFDPVHPQDVNTSLLPGTYYRTADMLRQTISFHKNGTFSGKLWSARGGLDDEYTDDWSVHRTYPMLVTLHYVVRQSRKIPKDTEDVDQIVVLNKKCLTIAPANGTGTGQRVWWRQQETEAAPAKKP